MTMAMLNVIELFLLMAFIVQFCWTEDCKKAIPGVSKMMHSLDITKIDLFPLGIYGAGGMRKQIIEPTCVNKRTWSDFGSFYFVPEQVGDIDTYNEGIFPISVDIYRNHKDVITRMKSEVQIPSVLAEYAFINSESYETTRDSLNDGQVIVDVNEKLNVYTIYLKDPKNYNTLKPTFLDDLKFLKDKTFKSNKYDFRSFIRHYGTHYIKEAEFGSMARQYMMIKTEYVKDNTDEELKSQGIESFNTLINRGNSSTEKTNELDVSPQWNNKAEFHGGEADVLLEDWYETWKSSVTKDPALIKIYVEPLYNLSGNVSINDQLKIATHDYVMRSYLSGLRQILRNSKSQDPNVKTFLNKITQLFRSKALDIDDVQELKNEINEWQT